MIRRDNTHKVKQEINEIRRTIRTTQAEITRACELVKLGKFNPEFLEKREKRFRTLRRKLSELQEDLNALQEGQEPVRIHERELRRPSAEARLIMFCEA